MLPKQSLEIHLKHVPFFVDIARQILHYFMKSFVAIGRQMRTFFLGGITEDVTFEVPIFEEFHDISTVEMQSPRLSRMESDEGESSDLEGNHSDEEAPLDPREQELLDCIIVEHR